MNYASRLHKLEKAIGSPPEAMHILRVIIDPSSPGDRALEVLAGGDGGSLTRFAGAPGESRDALCERAELVMGSS